MNPLETINARVVGITFDNEDGTSRQEIISSLEEGDSVNINYYNYEGSPAYSVDTIFGERIGNLNAKLASRIYNQYRGCSFDAHISEIYSFKDGEGLGCEITLDVYKSKSNISPAESAATTSLLTGNQNTSDSSYKICRTIFFNYRHYLFASWIYITT